MRKKQYNFCSGVPTDKKNVLQARKIVPFSLKVVPLTKKWKICVHRGFRPSFRHTATPTLTCNCRSGGTSIVSKRTAIPTRKVQQSPPPWFPVPAAHLMRIKGH